MDGAYARRAERAQAGQESELDKLLPDASVEGWARREADSEPLDFLMSKLPDHLKTATASELRQELTRRSRTAGLAFKDAGANWHLMIARIKRFLAIREAEEREQPSVKEKSSAWLSNSLQHIAVQPAQQPAQQPASGSTRQVQPLLRGPGDRDLGSRDRGHGGGSSTRQQQANPGAPPKKTKREQSLLQPTLGGMLGKWRQGGAGQQQQQQEKLGDLDSLCKICTQLPEPGSALRMVNFPIGGSTAAVLACARCFNLHNLQPVIARGAQADPAAHPTAAPPGTAATAKRKPIDRLPGLRPKLNLKPTEPFYGGTPAAPSALLDIGGSRPARQPTRGKGKQQPPGDEDGDWYPDERALQQQQQDADADDDSDFDWQHAPRRRPRPRQRTQAANVEPVTMTIDLLSDDDPEQQQQQQQQAAFGDGPAQPALPAPAADEGDGRRSRPPRAARAAQYVPVSERFKGLRCLYPRDGGPGSVEVTALDLSRLDDGEFLNDSVIDFYIRWLQDQLPPEVLKRCYFFNTFFFKKLVEDQGGSLTPELREWAEQEKIVKSKLQALHNHQKVKKWTKDVDLFAKDFIFVPVHEALHWSLMVVCHPGVVMPKDGDVQRPGAPTPCILHLDSLSGNHSGGKLANSLRLYLSFEWHIKSLPDAPDGVPKRWTQAHPGEKRSWLPRAFPLKLVKVPGQENHCDCGLFMCSYIEYFVHRLPRAINTLDVEALKNYSRTNRDLFEGTDDCVPGLLTDKWFPKDNPSHLRWRLRHNLLRLMAEQCGLVDPATHRWQEGNPMADEVQRELEQLQQRSLEYLSPAEWQSRAAINKEQRAAALRRREAEQEERKAARQQRQAAAAKSPGSTRSGSVDRKRLAAAAEARLGHEPSALFDGLRDVATRGEDEGSDLSFELQARQPAGQRAGEVQPQQQQQQQAPRPSSRLKLHSRQPRPGEAQLRKELGDGEACKQLAGSDPDGGGFEVVLNGSDGEDDAVGEAQEGVARDVVAAASLQPEPAVSEDLCPVPGLPPVAADGGAPPPEHAFEPSSASWQRGGAQPGAALGPATQLQQEAPGDEEIQVFSRQKKKQKQRQGVLGPAGSPELCPMQQLEEQSLEEPLGQGGPPRQQVLARDGTAAALDWGRVVHVAGLFSNGIGQETRRPDDRCTAELRFFYLDAKDYSARLPFPADRTAASLDSLHSWVRSHSQHLGRHHEPSWDLQHLLAWDGSEPAGQQLPRELRHSSKQGNGEATARATRGASAAVGSAPPDAPAAAAAAVAAAPFQQQQHQQQEGQAGSGGAGGEGLKVDGGLPSLPGTQRVCSQDTWPTDLAAASPANERAPGGPPAEQFIPLAGPAGADLEQSGTAQMQQELQVLRLGAQPRPAARAAAAAAFLQHRHDLQRQGSLAAAAACPLPNRRQQASPPALAAGEAGRELDPHQGAPAHGGSSKRSHATAPGGHEAELADKRRRRAGELRRLEHGGGDQGEAPVQEQQEQGPPHHQWNRHLLHTGAGSCAALPPSSEETPPAGQAADRQHEVSKPMPASTRPGSVFPRVMHRSAAPAPPPQLGSGHSQLGGASGRDPGSLGQQAGEAPLLLLSDGFGQPAAYDRRYAVQAAALVDDAVADAARQIQHTGHDAPAQQAYAAQPAAAADEVGGRWLAHQAQGQREDAKPAGLGGAEHGLTPHEVEAARQHANPPWLGARVEQRAKSSGLGALVKKLAVRMNAATDRVAAQQRQQEQTQLKRPRGGGKQLRPVDAVDLVSDDE